MDAAEGLLLDAIEGRGSEWKERERLHAALSLLRVQGQRRGWDGRRADEVPTVEGIRAEEAKAQREADRLSMAHLSLDEVPQTDPDPAATVAAAVRAAAAKESGI